jgi:heptosyltransferase III
LNKIRVLWKTIWILLTDRELAASFFRNTFSLLTLRLKFFFIRQKFIVIARTAHLGDIVATEPVARYMKGKFPKSFLLWVVGTQYAELITTNPNIDKAITVSCFTEWILLKHFLRKKNVYDLHITNQVCERHHFINIKSNPYDITFDNYLEKGNLLYAFSRSEGIEIPDNIAPCLYLNTENIAHNIPTNYIVMHTSSNHPDKMWSNECWNEMSKFILEQFSDYSIAEIGFEKKINIQDKRNIDLTGKKTLSSISKLINGCRLFVGIDSGLAHFANALDKDSLILIGTFRHFKNYMPYSGKFQREKDDIIFYYPGSLKNMPCQEMLDLVTKKLNS